MLCMNPHLETDIAESSVLILGANSEAAKLIEVYGLVPSSAVAVADRAEAFAGKPFGPFTVMDINIADLSEFGAVIVCEPDWVADPTNPGVSIDARPFTNQMLTERGARLDTIYWRTCPGSIHRILRSRSVLAKASPNVVEHQVIFRDTFFRAHYGYGTAIAVEHARRLGLKRVTLAETGVWFGAGLKNLCEFADFFSCTSGISVGVYGFDTGAGLPPVRDYRDHPELWQAGTMKMPDHDKLRQELPDFCELIIGDVKKTIPKFARDSLSPEAPLGFFALDVDLYSSSVDALKVFSAQDPRKLTPAVPIWVDDSYIAVTSTNFAGEALAIEEFNLKNKLRKIEKKIVRTDHAPALWHHCMYFAHIFDHPVRTGEQQADYNGFFINRY